MKKSKGKQLSIDMPGLFVIIIFGLMVSIGFIILGLYRHKPDDNKESASSTENEETLTSGDSLSEYFRENLPPESSFQATDEYMAGDPFLDICSDTSGDNLPAISTGTVCLR